MESFKKHNHIFTSKYIGNTRKIRTFNIYVSSVFLYNTETWAMNPTISNKIDSYHRRMLRYALNLKWPKKISNVDLYEKTRATPWSRAIKRRRLNFPGHIMRRNDNTPIRIALKEALKPTEGKRGTTENHLAEDHRQRPEWEWICNQHQTTRRNITCCYLLHNVVKCCKCGPGRWSKMLHWQANDKASCCAAL